MRRLLFFFSVLVIGAFTLCYLPGFICVLLTIKLGLSRIPNGFRSSVIVLVAINSALNPIIYMFRCNEFRIALKKLFRGTSIAPLAGRSRRQPSYPAVPTEDVKAFSCRVPTNSVIAVELTEVNLP